MAEMIMYTQLSREIGLPFQDVDIALARVPCRWEMNRRLYDKGAALAALADWFKEKADENRVRYERRGSPAVAARVRAYEEKLALVRAYEREWREADEQEGNPRAAGAGTSG